MTSNLNYDDDEKERPLNQSNNFYLDSSSMTSDPEIKYSSRKMVKYCYIFELNELS